MTKTLLAFAGVGLFASTMVAADPLTDRRHHFEAADALVPVQYGRSDDRAASINDREARMRARIEEGRQDGRITEREAHQLYRELGNIEAKERAFRSDGRIGGREQAELNADLDRLGEQIRDQARDSQRRY